MTNLIFIIPNIVIAFLLYKTSSKVVKLRSLLNIYHDLIVRLTKEIDKEKERRADLFLDYKSLTQFDGRE